MTPCEKFIQKLEEAGYEADRIQVTRGYWSHRHQDCCRWATFATRASDGMRVELMSYDTVTKCSRRPLVYTPDDYPLLIWVSVV